jgi:TPR repeat protein
LNISDLRKKSDSGSSAAQGALGICYLYGHEVEVDYKEAFRLLSLAGTSRAVVNLARMHAEGLGAPKDLPEAIRLYKSVAKYEFRAQLELGRIYSRGMGVQADSDEALKWYSAAAAARGDDDCVDDAFTAAFVGAGTLEEVQEARAYVGKTTRS